MCTGGAGSSGAGVSKARPRTSSRVRAASAPATAGGPARIANARTAATAPPAGEQKLACHLLLQHADAVYQYHKMSSTGPQALNLQAVIGFGGAYGPL
jgi:hypothetical protein